jgi:hypothetical protein
MDSREKLINIIKSINNKNLLIRIFKYIVDNKLCYTCNSNGIFFNVTVYPDDHIKNIHDLIINFNQYKNNIL